jgi:cation diffusion facilitator CzcD-associated flavoprotein CzcO
LSVDVHDAVVIGSGLAGLTAAFTLREHGIAPLILEREAEIGESWRKRHPQLTLNTHRDLSTLPGWRYPKGTGAFPKRDAVVRHLQGFAREHAFDIRYAVTARRLVRAADHIRIETDTDAILARHVVIATGRDTDKTLPDWPGLKDFQGRLLHAADLGDVRDYAGRRVLVVGGGNSGFDVLNHLSRVDTAAIWFSVRRGPALLPKRLLRLSVHRLSPLMQRLPVSWVDRLVAATGWMAFGRLSKLGFPPGTSDAATRLVHEQIAIPVDDGAIAAIRRGRVTVVKPVRTILPDTVVLQDGLEITPDTIIVATGYGQGPSPREKKVGGGVPTATGLDLSGLHLSGLELSGLDHAVIEAGSDGPGLWFTGMTPSLTSYFLQTRQEAILIARAIRIRNARTS